MKRGMSIIISFLFVLSLVFASNELSVEPYITTSSSNISLNFNATNYTLVWTNITLPNGEIDSITNQTNITFTNTSLVGRYNITFFINDSEGNVTNTTDYFEIFAPFNFSSTIKGYNNSNITYSYNFYYPRNIIYNDSSNTSLSLELPNSTFDLEYIFYSNDLKIYFDEINNSQSNKTINLNNISTIPGQYITYAINSTYNVSNTTLTIYYDNLSVNDESMLNLYRCNNWSFTNRTCLTSWNNITSNFERNTANNYFTYTYNGSLNLALGINETAAEEEEESTPTEDTPSETTETTTPTETTPQTTSDDTSEESPEWNLSESSFEIGENETVEIISEGGEYQITLGNTTYNVSIYNLTEDGAQFDIAGKTYTILFHETKEFTVDEHAVRISYLEKSEDKVKISFTRIVSGIELEASPIFGVIYEFVGGVLARNMIILITITLLSAIISHRDNPKKKSKSKRKK